MALLEHLVCVQCSSAYLHGAALCQTWCVTVPSVVPAQELLKGSRMASESL